MFTLDKNVPIDVCKDDIVPCVYWFLSNYASTVWGGAASGDINSLSIILKICARSILDPDAFSSYKSLLKKVNWLSISLYIVSQMLNDLSSY